MWFFVMPQVQSPHMADIDRFKNHKKKKKKKMQKNAVNKATALISKPL